MHYEIYSTSKQIGEGAYIKLYVTTFRGFTYWEEVQSEELSKFHLPG